MLKRLRMEARCDAMRRRKALTALSRVVTLATLVAMPCTAAMAQASGDFPQGVDALTAWFNHVQRDELDSLPALLASDFVFVSDGARFDRTKFVAMIKGLGIRHPRVQLSRVVAHATGAIGYVIYDRTESFESHGVPRVVPETGTMVLRREGARWLIVLWTTTSPPR